MGAMEASYRQGMEEVERNRQREVDMIKVRIHHTKILKATSLRDNDVRKEYV